MSIFLTMNQEFGDTSNRQLKLEWMVWFGSNRIASIELADLMVKIKLKLEPMLAIMGGHIF